MLIRINDYLCGMENKKQLGGKRRGAGRKPVLSKKKQISLYVEGVKIIKFGNEEKMKDSLYDFINKFGETAIVYTIPTADAYDGKKMDKITHDEPAQWVEPKSTVTGLPPKPELAGIGNADDFQDEILATTMKSELEAVMKRVKTALLPFSAKQRLEAIAKEHSKDFFTD